MALEWLKTSPSAALAVEDSAPSLAVAIAAGLRTVIVTNDYTLDHGMSGATLVLDGFEPDARVCADLYGLHPAFGRTWAILRAALAGTPISSPPTGVTNVSAAGRTLHARVQRTVLPPGDEGVEVAPHDAVAPLERQFSAGGEAANARPTSGRA